MTAKRELMRHPDVLAFKVLGRAKRWFDRPMSWLELRDHTLRPGQTLTRYERMAAREVAFCLMGATDVVVYDVGASTGTYARAMAKMASVEHVYAFEPILGVFETLQERSSDLGNITCINLALGNENGTAIFNLNDASASSSMLPSLPDLSRRFPRTASVREIPVAVRRLDDLRKELRLPLPFLVKMDVQGFEDRVIEGGGETFAAATWVLSEMSAGQLYKGSAVFDDTYQQLKAIGFAFAGFTEQLNSEDGEPLEANVLFRRASVLRYPAAGGPGR